MTRAVPGRAALACRRLRRIGLAVAGATLLVAGDGRAEPPPVSPARRAAAVGLAAVPGLVVPGLGARTVGQPRAARRLLVTAGVGLGLIVVGGVPIAATYGSGKVVVPGVPMVVTGVGLFLGRWWADIYTAAGGHGAPRGLPGLEVGVDGRWRRHPYLGDQGQLGLDGRWRRDRWELRGHAELAPTGLAGARLDGRVRLWAPRGRVVAVTGTAVDLRVGTLGRRDRSVDPTRYTGEVAVRARLDLADLDPGLGGSFLDGEAGLGLELTDYAVGDPDVNGVLLSRVGWGVYLPCGRGEVAGFYDHRRDGPAGGLAAGRAAGFFGSVGVAAEVVVTPAWTAAATVEVGGAWVSTLGIRRSL
ncbi:MAG: hypothetical protein R3B06_11175 [Kofleriaceae bacterium]